LNTVPKRYGRTDGQTDRRLTVASPRSALASRGNNYCVISILMPFIVIAASRPVNKNVNAGAVIRARPKAA